MAENPAQQHVIDVASEIADWNDRIHPCQLKEEVERRGRPRAPSPELEHVFLAQWTQQMDKVQLGCDEAHPDRPDHGWHWRIEGDDIKLYPLSEALPSDLERICNTLLKEWCPKIRSQPLLRQYRILEAAAYLSKTPAEREPEAFREFWRRTLEQFPDWPPLQAQGSAPPLPMRHHPRRCLAEIAYHAGVSADYVNEALSPDRSLLTAACPPQAEPLTPDPATSLFALSRLPGTIG